MTLQSKRLGINGEEIASTFLLKNGFTIIQTNFTCKLGELDIVAKKNQKLHFIEVKTRIGVNKGQPHEAVNFRKLQHIKNTIDYYLLKNKIKNTKLSIDVVSIVLARDNSVERLNLYENITL